ncbi:uncharacterized protein [Malus domestica]|uniref:uncharacterized protein isoform X2 n=1 Tax=Malus domestica TaxID=3750 RepID=UPI0039751F85
MESSWGAIHYLSSGKGKILSEEERAAENVYIQRKERGILEKQKAEKEKAEKAKENADKWLSRQFPAKPQRFRRRVSGFRGNFRPKHGELGGVQVTFEAFSGQTTTI